MESYSRGLNLSSAAPAFIISTGSDNMAQPNLEIRREAPDDIPAVRRVNLEAFNTPYEANLVDRLRHEGAHLLSLVAVKNSRIVGHILFSPVTIENETDSVDVAGLAPMAVYPTHQRSGIGSALIRASLDMLREAGIPAVVLLGHPDYYPKFGFQPASRFGIHYGYRVPDEAFMALELQEEALREVSGLAKYHFAFEDAQIGPPAG